MSFVKVSQIGEKSLDRVNKILQTFPSGAFKATYAALRRAGNTSKTQAGRFASARYTISKGDFMRNVTEKTVVKGDSGGVASMSITFAGHVLPLLTFKTNYSSDGRVQTQVMRNGGATTLQHAFTANIFGNVAVFERLGTSRFPVEQKFGPSTAHMMQNDEVIKQMDDTIRSKYEERIEHEILRIMNGW